MSRVAVLAWGAVSALGRARDAVDAGEPGARPRSAIREDAELARAGLARPFAARVGGGDEPAAPDRAARLLLQALEDCARELDDARPRWRRQRVGLVLGTSSGAMRRAEIVFAALAAGEPAEKQEGEGATYHGPLGAAARALGLSLDPVVLVLAACASSSAAIGLGARFVERGACDVVLAGGFDDVTVFVASGFEALRATTAAPPPRPFRAGRDGMSLGEGAAVLALARADDGGGAGAQACGYISGFGAACDAVHLTAPDRDGAGLARAAEAALAEAGRPAVQLVGAHGTATPFNDAAEARAIARALGPALAREIVVHPFKAQVGHTLGAAGALETLACLDAIARGVLPAAAGGGPIDPDAAVRLLDRVVPGTPETALKLSAAFGGANAALVVAARPAARARAFRPAFFRAAAGVDVELPEDELARRAHSTPDRLARADALVRIAMSAVARLEDAVGPLAGAGIVIGSAFATRETNAVFAARVREFGVRGAPARLFPYTSPNAAAGEIATAFGLTGPSLAVGGGWHAAVEAFAVAALLVEAGDADRVVVVGADAVGPVARALGDDRVRSGAVAALLSMDPGFARARVGQVVLGRGAAASGAIAPGHLALCPLTGGPLPGALESASPPDAIARITLEAR